MKGHQAQICSVQDKATMSLSHCHRIICLHARATTYQLRHNNPAGRGPHIVGVGLERQTPKSECPPRQILSVVCNDLVDQHMLLMLVDGLDGLEYQQVLAMLGCGFHQCLHILRKTAPAIAGTGVQEAVTDTRIGPYPLRTCSISTPTLSARLANSFMKLIRVASMAFAAYLVNSALRTSMCRMRS